MLCDKPALSMQIFSTNLENLYSCLKNSPTTDPTQILNSIDQHEIFSQLINLDPTPSSIELMAFIAKHSTIDLETRRIHFPFLVIHLLNIKTSNQVFLYCLNLVDYITSILEESDLYSNYNFKDDKFIPSEFIACFNINELIKSFYQNESFIYVGLNVTVCMLDKLQDIIIQLDVSSDEYILEIVCKIISKLSKSIQLDTRFINVLINLAKNSDFSILDIATSTLVETNSIQAIGLFDIEIIVGKLWDFLGFEYVEFHLQAVQVIWKLSNFFNIGNIFCKFLQKQKSNQYDFYKFGVFWSVSGLFH